MITNDLKGKRILVTQANTFMGPKLCEVFAEMGAEVITDNQLLTPALMSSHETEVNEKERL